MSLMFRYGGRKFYNYNQPNPSAENENFIKVMLIHIIERKIIAGTKLLPTAFQFTLNTSDLIQSVRLMLEL